MSDEIKITSAEERKSAITQTEIVVSEEKRDRIAELKFTGVESYMLDKEGKLSVIHEEDFVVNEKELKTAVESFLPPVPEPINMTHGELVVILRKKRII